MTKKVVILLIIFTLALTSFAFANGGKQVNLEMIIGNKEYKIGGEVKKLNAEPFIENGTTLIPLRGVLEALGAKVEWKPDTKQVVIAKGEDKIILTINSKTAIVNGNDVELSELPKIVKGNTLIPLRFVAENMGYEVKWNEAEEKISIRNSKEPLKDDKAVITKEETKDKLEENNEIEENESKDNRIANTDEKPKYEDWYYNDDFTKVSVKVDGKWTTYDNYVLLTREGDYLRFINLGSSYLTYGIGPYIYTPEEYFLNKIETPAGMCGIRKDLKNGQDGIEGNYPLKETININYRPWQETEFSDYIMNNYYRFRYRSSSGEKDDAIWEFVQDKSKNGYALEVLERGKTIEEAKKKTPIGKMKVKSYRSSLCRTYDEYKEMRKKHGDNDFIEITYDELRELTNQK